MRQSALFVVIKQTKIFGFFQSQHEYDYYGFSDEQRKLITIIEYKYFMQSMYISDKGRMT
jgi:hypothetical protein